MLPVYDNDLKKLKKDVHAALRAWGDLASTPENLLERLLLVKQRRSTVTLKSPASLRLATNQVLHEAIGALKIQDEQGARILESRFLDGDTILMAANKLNLSKDQIKRYQKKGIERLTNIVFDQEMAMRRKQIQVIEAQLAVPTYTHLFGVEALQQQLLTQLYSVEAPWVVMLTGIGGIGKTSLADAVVRRVMNNFRYERVVWVRVNSPTMNDHHISPRLTLESLVRRLSSDLLPDLGLNATTDVRHLEISRILKRSPHLVVIDNLEIEADTVYLLDHLSDWANPSKFVLTARARPPRRANVAHFSLEELSFEATVDLIRHHAGNVGLDDLAQLTPMAARSIYEVTGGNPLAVKLVVGLATVLPLERVLHELRSVKSEEVEQMYRHIYWQAWHSLGQESRALLEMMVLVADVGVTPEVMLAMGRLTAEQLWPAISELVNRSLLEVRGTTWQRRYNIHRLTESFLHTEIIHWPKDAL